MSKEAEDAAIRNFVDSALRAGTIRVTYSAGTLGDDPQAREVLPGGGGAAIRLRPDGSRDIIIAVVRF